MKINYATICLIGFLLAISPGIHSQHIERDVLASAGNSSHPQLEWTVGELAVTQLNSMASVEQGFHHVIFTTTSVNEIDHDFSISVYPNPVISFLNIEHDFGGMLNYQLTDSQSRSILTGNNLTGLDQIDVSNLMPGIYYLKLYENNKLIKLLKIIKA